MNSVLKSVPMSDVPVMRSAGSRRSSGGSFGGLSKSVHFEVLAPIDSQPVAEAQKHLVLKLRSCQICFNFCGADDAIEAKEAKRETLLEIVHYIVGHPNCLTPDAYMEISAMVEANVWRPLGPKVNLIGERYDPEEIESVDDLAWSHLHIVYEILLQVFDSPNFDKSLAKAAFSKNFALHLLKMFDSEDERERLFLKTAIHRLYRHFVHLRNFMRDQVQYILQDLVETQDTSFSGVAEILEILGSIVEGFAVPLKESHANYLKRVLLPLSKMPRFILFHTPWLYCVHQYLVKDPNLAAYIFRHLFRHWPVQTARKQVLLLHCVETMLGSLSNPELDNVSTLLFVNLAKILRSPHFQVADRCLALLQNTRLREHVRRNASEVIPVLYPAMALVAREHWNGQIESMAQEFLRWFKNLNPTICRQLSIPGSTSSSSVKSGGGDPWQRLLQLEQQPIQTKQKATRSRANDETHLLLAKYGISSTRSVGLSSKENAVNQ